MNPDGPLFTPHARTQRVIFGREGSYLDYIPGWLDGPEAHGLMGRLLPEPFEVEVPEVRGRRYKTGRASVAWGDPGIVYRYSGITHIPRRWPEALAVVNERLGRQTLLAWHTDNVGPTGGYPFALGVFYPSGDVELGWHADDEKDLDPGAPIASLSMGSTRDFCVRDGNRGPAILTLPLSHGDLMIMGGPFQRYYQHSVPARKRIERPRLNVTFRVVRR